MGIGIEFCGCGGIFIAKDSKILCRSCGKENEKHVEVKITKTEKKDDIVVIEDNKVELPVTERSCPDCDNKMAYWWLIQTRSSDEPPTQFFRCVKCKHTWREYK